MENASKALIIAGAILVAILLISIAVIIINQGKGITGSSGELMSAQEVQVFNAQFTPYEGKKKGRDLQGLQSTVQASNAQHEQAEDVTLENYNLVLDNPSGSFNCSLTYGTNGRVKTITISSI